MQIKKIAFTLFELIIVVLLIGLVYSFGLHAFVSNQNAPVEHSYLDSTKVISLLQTKEDGFSIICLKSEIDCQEYQQMALLRDEIVSDIAFEYKHKFYIVNKLMPNAQEYQSLNVYTQMQKQLQDEASNSVF